MPKKKNRKDKGSHLKILTQEIFQVFPCECVRCKMFLNFKAIELKDKILIDLQFKNPKTKRF